MLPTGDPLGAVVTMLATPFGRLDGLAIDTAVCGGWLPTGSLPDSTSKGIIDGLPSSVSFPRRKVVVDGPPWGEISCGATLSRYSHCGCGRRWH